MNKPLKVFILRYCVNEVVPNTVTAFHRVFRDFHEHKDLAFVIRPFISNNSVNK